MTSLEEHWPIDAGLLQGSSKYCTLEMSDSSSAKNLQKVSKKTGDAKPFSFDQAGPFEISDKSLLYSKFANRIDSTYLV